MRSYVLDFVNTARGRSSRRIADPLYHDIPPQPNIPAISLTTILLLPIACLFLAHLEREDLRSRAGDFRVKTVAALETFLPSVVLYFDHLAVHPLLILTPLLLLSLRFRLLLHPGSTRSRLGCRRHLHRPHPRESRLLTLGPMRIPPVDSLTCIAAVNCDLAPRTSPKRQKWCIHAIFTLGLASSAHNALPGHPWTQGCFCSRPRLGDIDKRLAAVLARCRPTWPRRVNVRARKLVPALPVCPLALVCRAELRLNRHQSSQKRYYGLALHEAKTRFKHWGCCRRAAGPPLQ